MDAHWRSLVIEDVIEPELEIIDAHHHLWEEPPVPVFESYGEDAVIADQMSGHNVVASVYLEAESFYRQDGPEHLRPVGETEFINDVAERLSRRDDLSVRPCAAIVAHADLLLGHAVEEVLDAHREASPDRFVGVRHRVPFDPEVPLHSGPRGGMLLEDEFRRGFAQLGPAGLVFDAMVFQTQLHEVQDLAESFPDTKIVLNHVGAPLGIGVYENRREEMFDQWKQGMRTLSTCGNVSVKLGGLYTDFTGLDRHDSPLPPDSDAVALAQRDYMLTTIDYFGPERCMFESNFPLDMHSVSYVVLWNAFKKMVKDLSADDKVSLFSGTARSVYRIENRPENASGPALAQHDTI